MVSLAMSGCTENQYGKDGCEPDPNLCRIVCQKDAECELQESDPQTPTCSDGGVTLPENYESFAEDMCKTECAKSDTEEDDAKRCRFWRFDHLGTTKTCSLMTDTQCTVFDPCFGHCHCGDQGCPDDTIPAPPGTACAAPIEFEKNHIHWTCHNTGITGEIQNPYSPSTTDLPPNTECTSVSKCADWGKSPADPNLAKKLQVSCNGTLGKWVIDQDAGGEDAVYEEEVINNEGLDPIGEPSCTGGGLQLEIPEANIVDGTQLVCDTPLDLPEGGNYKMGHPNTCILLCDYQLGMTINSALNEEGEAVFKNQDGSEITGSAVTCWGK